MKKTIMVLLCIFIAIIASLFLYYQETQKSMDNVKKFNAQFEQYFDKEISGAEIVTLINKAIDNNVKYEIAKSNNGKYIEDDKYCLKVILKFKDVDTLYEMESIDKAGTDGFIKNFNMSTFKISDYRYNSITNRIGKLVVEEIKIGNV